MILLIVTDTLLHGLKRISPTCRSRFRFSFSIGPSVAVAAAVGLCLLLLVACGNGDKTPSQPPSPGLPTITPFPTTLFNPTPTIRQPAGLNDPGPVIAGREVAAADLAIQIAGPEHPIPDLTAVYSLTIYNHGPGMATGIELTDTLAGGAVPVWVLPEPAACGRQGREVNCTLSPLQAGDSVTVTLDLSASVDESIITGTHPAGVVLDPGTLTCILDSGPLQDQVRCHLDRLPAGATTEVNIGTRIDNWPAGLPFHTATVTAHEPDENRSNNRATFTLIDEAPALPQGEVAGPPAAPPIPSAPDLMIQAAGPLSVVAGRPFTVTFTISNQGARDATAVRFESALPPATTLVAYAPALPHCERQADALTCTLVDLDSGEAITFTLAITGHTEQPVIIEPDSLSPGWPICTVVKERTYLHIVQCDLGTLGPGQQAQVHLTLFAEGVQERQITSTAQVGASEADLTPADNTITRTMSVSTNADLTIQSEMPQTGFAGEPLSYTLTIANRGPSDAANVMLTDTLPAGMHLLSALSSQGEECRFEQDSLSATIIVCELGHLSSGETASATLVVAADSSLPPALAATMTHSARVESAQVDPHPEDNVLTEEIPANHEDD